MNKLIKRVFLRVALLLFFSSVLISIAFIVSPWPSALIIKKQFSGTVHIKDQKYFDKAKKMLMFILT
ncbi:hypothetical protein [Leuconostoc palmae]|uniref:hypothetical protein n=1 Tax=Leuconostoc palmae TaxID=501487 RepID=UPI001C7D5486|nr:hypothetical protein [Leuconostoc palmae]